MFAETREEYTQRRARLGIFPAKPVVKMPKPPPPLKKERDFLYVEEIKDDPEKVIKNFKSWPLPQALAWKQIVSDVCDRHGVSFIDICSARRDRKTAAARSEVSYRLRKETTLSLPQIGRKLGGRDHTTILHNVRRYEAKLNGTEYRKTSYVSTANKGDGK